MKERKLAVKEPLKDWQAQTVADKLQSYQQIVGGYIEHIYSTAEGILLFGNEEGLISSLPFNLKLGSNFIFGTVFAVRSDEEGEFQSLTDEDLALLKAGKLE